MGAQKTNLKYLSPRLTFESKDSSDLTGNQNCRQHKMISKILTILNLTK